MNFKLISLWFSRLGMIMAIQSRSMVTVEVGCWAPLDALMHRRLVPPEGLRSNEAVKWVFGKVLRTLIITGVLFLQRIRFRSEIGAH